MLATLARVEAGVHRLLLEATGALAAILVATQASLSPTSPSTQTAIWVVVVQLPVVTMAVASELASSQLPATWTDVGASCGNTGHFARDCPEPRKQSGDCFNCGQAG